MQLETRIAFKIQFLDYSGALLQITFNSFFVDLSSTLKISMTLPNSDLKDGTRVVCEYKILTFIGNSLKKRWSFVLTLIQESTATFVLKKRNNPIFFIEQLRFNY